jgi:hypothetical protein
VALRSSSRNRDPERPVRPDANDVALGPPHTDELDTGTRGRRGRCGIRTGWSDERRREG